MDDGTFLFPISESGDRGNKKSDVLKKMVALRKSIRCRADVSVREGKKFGLDRIVERYNLTEVQRDIILVLLYGVVKASSEFMTASKILQIVSRCDYEKLLDRHPLMDLVKKGVVTADVRGNCHWGTRFFLKQRDL